MLSLNGCAISQYYRDRQNDQKFYQQYRPPIAVNNHPFGSPITSMPDRVQLINGDGYEYSASHQRRKVVVNYAHYFVPGDAPPFDPPARVTSVEYFYCMLGDAPTMCGSRVIYESEEVFGPAVAMWNCGCSVCLRSPGYANDPPPPPCISEIKDIAKIRKTNHELIIDQLIERHGRHQRGSNDTRVFTEEADGTIHRGSAD